MKTKTILVITSTLILGFILGFFTSGRLAHQRMKHFRDMMDKPMQEKMHLMKRLELTDEQVKQIEPILDSMIPIQQKLRAQHKLEMDASRKQMFEKMKPVLNKVQLMKIERMQRMGPFGPEGKKTRR